MIGSASWAVPVIPMETAVDGKVHYKQTGPYIQTGFRRQQGLLKMLLTNEMGLFSFPFFLLANHCRITPLTVTTKCKWMLPKYRTTCVLRQ